MTVEEFKAVADRLKGMTEYIYYHVMGEPLLHPQLPEFIAYATENGFKSAVTTNGSLLSAKGDALIASGVYKVNISVHSFESGDEDSYRNYIFSCLDFAEKAAEKGILTVLRLWNKGCDNGLNDGTVEIIKKRFGKFEHNSPRGARIKNKLHLEYGERFSWPDMNESELGSAVFCYGLKDHFAILSDGSIVPCCLDREGAITLGNIYTDLPEEVLTSERAIAMRRGFECRHATEELCRKCGYARRF